MSTALVLSGIGAQIISRVQGVLGASFDKANVVLSSPEKLAANKIGIYFYHFNRNPHFVNEPDMRVEKGKYRRPILAIDANLVIFTSLTDFSAELNHLENIADDFFRTPFFEQNAKSIKNTVKIHSKELGLEEINKFWSMYSGKSQRIALFYQLSPILVYPKTDSLDTRFEVQPVSKDSDMPKINLNIETL